MRPLRLLWRVFVGGPRLAAASVAAVAGTALAIRLGLPAGLGGVLLAACLGLALAASVAGSVAACDRGDATNRR